MSKKILEIEWRHFVPPFPDPLLTYRVFRRTDLSLMQPNGWLINGPREFHDSFIERYKIAKRSCFLPRTIHHTRETRIPCIECI